MGTATKQAPKHKDAPRIKVFTAEEKAKLRPIARSIVNRHTIMAGAASAVPVPVFDVAALTGVQLKMINKLCQVYDEKFSRQAGLFVITSLLAGAIPAVALTSATSLLKALPGVGSVAGMIAMPVTGTTVVYALGMTMIRHFESGGNLLNCESDEVKEFFARELKRAQTIDRLEDRIADEIEEAQDEDEKRSEVADLEKQIDELKKEIEGLKEEKKQKGTKSS